MSSKKLCIALLATRRTEAAQVGRSFGGTTLYASNQSILDACITRLEHAIESAAKEHLILARVALASVVSKTIGEDIERSVFGAVFGRLLCMGRVVGIASLTINSRCFWGYAHSTRLPEIENHLRLAEETLKKKQTLSVREAESLVFPTRAWGTWTASSFLLGNLAYKGRAVLLDKDLFGWPGEIEHAISNTVH